MRMRAPSVALFGMCLSAALTDGAQDIFDNLAKITFLSQSFLATSVIWQRANDESTGLPAVLDRVLTWKILEGIPFGS